MSVEETELIIRLPSQSPHAHVTLIQDGIEKEKDVSVDNLISHLAQNHQFSTGLLPQGTRIYRGTTSDYKIAIEMPAKIRPMTYARIVESDRQVTETTRVPFPICIFVFSIRSSEVRYSGLYCVRNPIQRLEDHLCYFPFGNVYVEGNICWGGAQLSRVNAPMELVGVINSFFDSVYNGDLFDSSMYNQPSHISEGEVSPHDFWSFIRYLDGKSEFPAEMLKTNERRFSQVI